MLCYESLKGDSSEQHFLSSLDYNSGVGCCFGFVFFFTATHGISILRNMLENTNLEDKSLEPQRLPSSPALAFTPGAWGPLFSSHSEQHTMHAPASMFYSELLLKNLPSSTGDIKDGGLIPESGRYPGVGNSQTVNF